jgi:predicted SAM-dependent methyltransferase
MKLNLGGGLQKIPGFTTLDRQTGQEVFPLPAYADGSVDEVRASHILEHFGHREAVDVLKEWVRVLKPGGRLRIAVPDLQKIVARVSDPSAPVEGWLMGGQTDDSDFHKSVYTEAKLRDMLRYVGLTDVTTWESEIQDCASLPISLNLQGVKPSNMQQLDGRIEVKARVAAVMSVPRLGWNDHWGCAWQALRSHEFNIPLYKFGGAFWEQGIQRSLNVLIEQNIEWAIALDYDTLFTGDDVRELLTLAAQYPDADAIVPVQVRRNNEQFLFTMKDAFGQLKRSATLDEFEPDLTPIETGHFGMTLIKLRALQDIPKPWLWSQPGPSGDWDDDKIDADIYFWKKWREYGKTIYQANHIKLGHLQVVSTWPTNDWQIKHQYLNDWAENGKPKECRIDED